MAMTVDEIWRLAPGDPNTQSWPKCETHDCLLESRSVIGDAAVRMLGPVGLRDLGPAHVKCEHCSAAVVWFCEVMVFASLAGVFTVLLHRAWVLI